MNLFFKSIVHAAILLFTNISYAQLSNFNDEFEGVSLDPSWLHYQSQYFVASISNGQLSMDINGANCGNNCPWFHAAAAGFIYKMVGGDFEVVTIARAEQATGVNQGDDISNDTQLGGLLIRNGNTSAQNYVFNVVGTRFDVASIETKSTTSDNSGTIEHFAISQTRAELKVTRQGSIFTAYSRNIGAEHWILRSTFNRPDLPDTLQVGLIAYVFESYPENIVVKFDYVRFSNLVTENQWLGGNGWWHDASMWTLNVVPDSTHSVIIPNAQPQTIQILSQENFKCRHLDVQGVQTELIIDGQFEVKTFD